MAGFWDHLGGPLSEDQIEHLIQYLQSLSALDVGPVSVSGDIARGGLVYRGHCAVCHGAQGQGGAAPSLNSPYFLATATDGFLRYAILYGRPETPMKGFAGKLTPQQADDVTRFIRSWTRNVVEAPAVGEVVHKLSDLVLNPAGPLATFALTEDRYVSASQVAEAILGHRRLIVLDARPRSDWIASHIPGAYPVPFYDELDSALLASLPRNDTWIAVYCSCPHAASGLVVDRLRKEGFMHSAVIEEGFLEWTRRKYPVTFGVNE